MSHGTFMVEGHKNVFLQEEPLDRELGYMYIVKYLVVMHECCGWNVMRARAEIAF